MIVLPVPSLLSSLVLAELQQADLITIEEGEGLSDISDAVRVQRDKPSEVMSKTAVILGRHGFENESRLLAGIQSRPSFFCLCYVHKVILF